MTVTVTGAAFDPQVYDPVDAGCSGAQPSCFHFAFGGGQTSCGLGVEPTGLSADQTGQTELTVTGTVVCAQPQSPGCTAFFDEVTSEGGSTIEVDAPAVDAPAPTATSGPTTTSTPAPTSATTPTP